jgi:serine/threonine protein kinase
LFPAVKVAPGVRIGPYEVMEQVGRGGMATVYKAYHQALERMVAIKVLPDFLAEDPEFRERFRREAIAIARLRHPNILAVFDHGEFDGQPYIVTEFVEGGTFANELGNPLAMGRALEVLGSVGSALDYAHQQGVLHRDVKPSNILMTRDGKSVLSDFGLARMMTSTQRLTRLDMVVGTPEYMSPEQCASGETGPASDEYSLGVVAFEALTGHPPYHADTPAAVMLAQMRSPLPAPRAVNPNLPSAVELALVKALAKEPGDRYPSCTAFVDALTATPADVPATAVVAAPTPAPASSKPTTSSAPTAPRRIPTRVLAIAATAVIGVLLVGGIAYAIASSRPGTQNAASTTPSADGGPAHGSLIFDAKVSKAAWGGIEPSPDPAGALTYAYTNSIDIQVLKDSSLSAEFDAPSLKNYVAHVVFHVKAGSDFYFDWAVRGQGPTDDANIYLNIDVTEETLTLVFSPNHGSDQADTATLQVPGMQNGKMIDLAISVNGNVIELWVNGKRVAQKDDGRATGATTPGFYLNGKSGALHIDSLRYYATP